jgi:hypothetical protein
MNPLDQYISLESRRQFLGKAAKGLGIAALSTILGPAVRGSGTVLPALGPGSLGSPHFPAKAKRAIYLFMSGAPSQLDLYDYKPEMKALFDTDLPDSVRRGQRLTTMTSDQVRFPIAPTIYNFEQVGKSGAWMSELLPYTKKIADDIAIIKSMWTEAINHDPAITYIQTGSQIPGRPSIGAWLSYGLGSLNENLPTFVVLNSTWTGRKDAQALFSRLWGSGPLPSEHQGVSLRSKGDPVLYLTDPHGVDRQMRRDMLNGVNEINEDLYQEFGDPETHARISQYEMAFRMQTSVPELTDLSDEPEYIFDLYGPDAKVPGTFAYNCLMARRFAEKGVRFSQIFHRGWDQHGILPTDLPNQCRDVDQPCYALITDLKQRGMFDDTLVVWGGEFGRTIYCQGELTESNYGRDHHPRCFSIWMSGAGIKGGAVYGDTDEFGYNITENPVHIRDLGATILDRFGINHEILSFKHQGLDLRLTGVEEAHIVKEILT